MAGEKKSQGQSIPPQVLIVIGIILIIASGVVGYLGVYDPAVQDYERARQNVITKQNELDDVQKQEEEYINYRKASEQLEKRLIDLKTRIPSSVDELNNFLASINQRARASRIAKWTLYKQEGNIKKGDYDAVPIRMEFVATYDAARSFFWELAAMGDETGSREMLINIRDVQITRDTTIKDAIQTFVKVICVAETYLYTGGSKNTGDKTSKSKKK